MKKHTVIFTLFILLTSFFLGCEKDEICLEEITPKLVIRFYDNEDPTEYKSVSNLKIQLVGIDGEYIDQNIGAAVDSVAIPIKVTEDSTTFQLILNGNDTDLDNDNEDVFTLNYTREDIFVSRSCGYKTVFHDATTQLNTDSDNWIISIETVEDPQSITTQKSKHVKIFH